MEIIDKLIKSLEEAKAELSKNMNCAPGANPNMTKEEAEKVNLNNPYNEQPKGSKKKKQDEKLDLAGPGDQFGDAKKSEELEKDAVNPALAPKEVKIKKLQAQIDAGTYKPNASKIAEKMIQKEELVCSENGQWKLMGKINLQRRHSPDEGKKI